MYTSKKIKKILCVIFVACFSVFFAFAEILICPHCGYECADGASICEHCKGSLPIVEKPATDGDLDVGVDVEQEGGNVEFLDTGIVKREMKIGQKYLQNGNITVGRLLLRNASALDMLTDPGSGNARSMKIANALKNCDSMVKSFRRKCSVCNGSGKASMLTTTFAGETAYKEVAGRLCRNCRGRGYVLGVGSPDELNTEMGRGLKEYVRLQKGRRFFAVGQAWVPVALEGKLTQRQMASLMRTVASPCHVCMGIGKVYCAKCEGTGLLPCSVRGCVGGMVESVLAASLVKSDINRRRKCKDCGGTGMQACDYCFGKGSVICTACNGSGERIACKKCGGQGLMACSLCKGSGKYKGEDCLRCAGGGVVLCSTCHGDGKRK